jgi:hypothetical protein
MKGFIGFGGRMLIFCFLVIGAGNSGGLGFA